MTYIYRYIQLNDHKPWNENPCSPTVTQDLLLLRSILASQVKLGGGLEGISGTRNAWYDHASRCTWPVLLTWLLLEDWRVLHILIQQLEHVMLEDRIGKESCIQHYQYRVISCIYDHPCLSKSFPAICNQWSCSCFSKTIRGSQRCEAPGLPPKIYKVSKVPHIRKTICQRGWCFPTWHSNMFFLY